MISRPFQLIDKENKPFSKSWVHANLNGASQDSFSTYPHFIFSSLFCHYRPSFLRVYMVIQFHTRKHYFYLFKKNLFSLPKRPVYFIWKLIGGTSLAVQWLRLRTSIAGGTDSIPVRGTKIPRMLCGAAKKKKN